MSLKTIISSSLIYLFSLPKKKLVGIIDDLRTRYVSLEKENVSLKKELDALKSSSLADKVREVNKTSNKPSSKQAEWELKGVGNDGRGKPKKRGRKGRKGAGNRPKIKDISKQETATVELCDNCGGSLVSTPVLESFNTRIIEDIPTFPIETEVIEVIQKKKYCHRCQKVTTARSTRALSHSDIGLNTTIHLIYFWVGMCAATTRIAEYMQQFFGQSLSTAGISSHIIRVAGILKPVQEGILNQLKNSPIIQADETGWRVNGKNWWLWVLGNQQWAYYTIDKSRGKDVVRRMLGDFFLGVLVVDGWKAYLFLDCEQQSCMAHLLRKIRKLHKAFPNLRSVFKFYVKFRKILRDGERLQAQREELADAVFQRRLKKLHTRLDQLLKWSNPNDILKDIIKKVKNQQPRILTFVEHPNVPCHNNFAEYLIRIGVLKRKVSFGSKSAKGAEAYATLLSIHSTCKLQKIPFHDFIRKSLVNYIGKGQPLLIQEYQSIQNQQNQKVA